MEHRTNPENGRDCGFHQNKDVSIYKVENSVHNLTSVDLIYNSLSAGEESIGEFQQAMGFAGILRNSWKYS